jgi:hypothetical protein
MKVYRPIDLDGFANYSGFSVNDLLVWHKIDPAAPLTIVEAHMIASDLQRWLREHAKAGTFA